MNKLSCGDRVKFHRDDTDQGTVARVVKSRSNPMWERDEVLLLSRAIHWYLITWDRTARSGEIDPEVWWTESDLVLLGG